MDKQKSSTNMTQTRGRTRTNALKMRAMRMVKTAPNKEEREDLKMTMLGETSSANIAIKPICLIPPFTHIWSKSIPRVQMASWEIHQQAEEAEVAPEKIHTKDWTQGLKTSSKQWREKEALSILFAATRRSTTSSFQGRTTTRHNQIRTCLTTQFTSTSSNFRTWLIKMVCS